MKLQQDGKLMSVIQRYDETQNVVWDISAPEGVPLIGKPWDARKKPRATLRRDKVAKKGSLLPTLLIEVHCRRQDLKISDVQIRDKLEFERLKKSKQFNNRAAAAECAIRERLIRNGANLTSPNLPGKIALAIFPCDEIGT